MKIYASNNKFKLPGYKPRRWWVRFCLFFCKTHVSIDLGYARHNPSCAIYFKVFRDVIYITKVEN